ncbi:hypothetical protein AG1IA_09304 [Rhizoctonia solani AG-1 IA]|uniref:Uncharacterized protein n=1 Tax=Thanatephorus cucumeris (strain AG1-IA) TaxID=983506 RepID=L8WEP8_THACA|nr:hypothetical protein AG1IA_09304 [Rhizoctonia solani AG-1 IA]
MDSPSSLGESVKRAHGDYKNCLVVKQSRSMETADTHMPHSNAFLLLSDRSICSKKGKSISSAERLTESTMFQGTRGIIIVGQFHV